MSAKKLARDPYNIDSQKIALHPERVARWLVGRNDWETARDIFPLYIEISPFGACNHACSFCGVDYMLDRDDKPKIAEPLMERTLSDMAAHGVKSVMFAGAGEPLLYKPLARMIHHAAKVGIDTSITTNGVLLTKPFAEQSFRAERLRWIKVSINGGDSDSYRVIHHAKPGDFDLVLRNLEEAVRVREQLGSRVTLGAQIVALPETDGLHPKSLLRIPSNIHTIEPLAKRLRDIGVDYLVVKPYSQHEMSSDTRAVYHDVNYRDANQWMEPLEALSTDRFRVIARTQTMQEHGQDHRGYTTCHATPFLWAYIEADGNVWGCSAYLGRTEGDKRFGDDRFLYGNIEGQAFSDIWRSEKRRQNWEYVRNGLDITSCRVNCRMNMVNLFMERLARPEAHDAFI